MTDVDTHIYVRLTNEPVNVWRPVKARRLKEGIFQILQADVPADEEWEFKPGQIVNTEPKEGRDKIVVRAVSLVKSLNR